MSKLGLKPLFRNFTTTFVRQISGGLLGFITVALIARVYGPDGNGLLAVAMLLPHLLSTLLNLGLTSANVYFLASGQVSR